MVAVVLSGIMNLIYTNWKMTNPKTHWISPAFIFLSGTGRLINFLSLDLMMHETMSSIMKAIRTLSTSYWMKKQDRASDLALIIGRGKK